MREENMEEEEWMRKSEERLSAGREACHHVDD